MIEKPGKPKELDLPTIRAKILDLQNLSLRLQQARHKSAAEKVDQVVENLKAREKRTSRDR